MMTSKKAIRETMKHNEEVATFVSNTVKSSSEFGEHSVRYEIKWTTVDKKVTKLIGEFDAFRVKWVAEKLGFTATFEDAQTRLKIEW